MDTAVEGSTLRGSLALQVGARIRKLRKRRDLTLKQLAKLCRTSPQTVCRLEGGEMTISLLWLERIAAALEIEPYELLADGALERAQNAKAEAEMRMASMRGALSQLYQTVEAAYGEEELRR